MKPLELIGGFGAAGGQDMAHGFAAKSGAAWPVSPAERQHEVNPLLHERRGVIPIHRVVPQEDVVAEQQGLLFGDVDVEVRVQLVQIPKRQIVLRGTWRSNLILVRDFSSRGWARALARVTCLAIIRPPRSASWGG